MDVNDQEPPLDLGEVADWVLDQVADHLEIVDDLPGSGPEPADQPDDHLVVDLDPAPAGGLDDPDAGTAWTEEPSHEASADEGSGTADEAPAGAEGTDPQPEIDLSLDEDEGADPLAPDLDRGAVEPDGGLAAAVELDPTGATWPDPLEGVAPLATLEHALGSLGAPDLDEVVSVVAQLGFGDELDLGLDGRTTAVVLGELGVDALVDHGSLDDLAERLAAGDEILLGGTDGQTLTVRHVDSRAVVVAPIDGGPPTELPAARFEAAWSRGGYEMVVADPATTRGSAIDLSGGITVLPLTLSLEQPSG